MAKPASPTWNASGVGGAGCLLYALYHQGSGTPTNLVTGANLAVTGSPTWTTGAYGPQRSGFLDTAYDAFDGVADDLMTFPRSIAVLYSTSSSTPGQCLLSAGNSGTDTPVYAVSVDLNDWGGVIGFLRDDAGNVTNPGAAAAQDGTVYLVQIVSLSASDHRVYLNGVEASTATDTLGTSTFNQLTIGALRRSAVSQPHGGAVIAAGAWAGSYPVPADLDADWRGDVWSAANSANVPPDQPTLTPGTPTTTGCTLTSSAFADADVGDTHAASQWQVTTSADTGYASPVISTGDDATNKTSYAATGLTAATAYRARVRHKDSAGNYSSWSSDATFTTASAITTFPLHRAAYGAEAQLAAGYTAGDPTLTVPDGSAFGTEFPMWVGCFRETGGEMVRLSVLEITGRTGDALDVGGAAGGTTDVDLEVGDWVVNVIDPLYLHEIHARLASIVSGFWAMTWKWSGSGVTPEAHPDDNEAEADRVAFGLRLTATAGTFTADIETSDDGTTWDTLATLALASGTRTPLEPLADLAIPEGTLLRATITAAAGLDNPRVVLYTRRG